MSSIEEIYFFFKFFKNIGACNFLVNETLYNFNIDLPLFYQFNSNFYSIEKSDLILLVYTNPRIESSMLNLKIRKQVFNKDILIANIGVFNDLNYNI